MRDFKTAPIRRYYKFCRQLSHSLLVKQSFDLWSHLLSFAVLKIKKISLLLYLNIVINFQHYLFSTDQANIICKSCCSLFDVPFMNNNFRNVIILAIDIFPTLLRLVEFGIVAVILITSWVVVSSNLNTNSCYISLNITWKLKLGFWGLKIEYNIFKKLEYNIFKKFKFITNYMTIFIFEVWSSGLDYFNSGLWTLLLSAYMYTKIFHDKYTKI